ncbi:hypothetical protein FB451DRAFT_6771 [Mycena latifolia]|nr:hypothetical protein FB451DRAFT_6771 [Mycena latifolia]
MTIDKFSLFRIISFSIAGGDVLQTMPGTYRLYKKQFVNRSLSPMCFFYAMARYMSILSLISNGIGFFGTNFTPSSCRRFYMLPNITAMLAGMSVQVLIFIRTYAISGRSIYVWFGLGSFLILCFPVQVFGITYHRDPFLSHGSCKGKVLRANEPDWNIVYYSATMAFDLVACVTATMYLVLSSQIQGFFNTSKFVRRVLRNGLLYTLVVFIANLYATQYTSSVNAQLSIRWVVLEFAKVMSTGAASTLPLAVVMIAAQHLILSTQPPHSDSPSSTDESPRPLGQSGPARFFNGNNTQQDVELQSSVFVVTETHVDPPREARKTNYEPQDRPSFDGSVTSRADTKLAPVSHV